MRIAPASAHKPGRERLAQREHAPADAVLRLEQDRVVPGAQQLRSRDEPGHARADDHDARRARRRAAGARRARISRCSETRVGITDARCGRSRTTSSSASAGEHGVARRVERAAAVDEDADEQRVVHVLQRPRARAARSGPTSSGGTGTRYSSWPSGWVSRSAMTRGEAVRARRRRQQRAGELRADHELVGVGALEVLAVLRLDHLDARVRVGVDRLDGERGEQRARVEVVGLVARVRCCRRARSRSTRGRGRRAAGRRRLLGVAADERDALLRRAASVSRSARITISRVSSTSSRPQLADDLGALRAPAADQDVARSLERPHPCSSLDDGGHEPGRDGRGRRTRPGSRPRPARSSTTRSRTGSSACTATCSRTACGRASRRRRRRSARRRSARARPAQKKRGANSSTRKLSAVAMTSRRLKRSSTEPAASTFRICGPALDADRSRCAHPRQDEQERPNSTRNARRSDRNSGEVGAWPVTRRVNCGNASGNSTVPSSASTSWRASRFAGSAPSAWASSTAATHSSSVARRASCSTGPRPERSSALPHEQPDPVAVRRRGGPAAPASRAGLVRSASAASGARSDRRSRRTARNSPSFESK